MHCTWIAKKHHWNHISNTTFTFKKERTLMLLKKAYPIMDPTALRVANTHVVRLFLSLEVIVELLLSRHISMTNCNATNDVNSFITSAPVTFHIIPIPWFKCILLLTFNTMHSLLLKMSKIYPTTFTFFT